MLRFYYSKNERTCTDAALALEQNLSEKGKKAVLISARHIERIMTPRNTVLEGADELIVDEAGILGKGAAQFLYQLSSNSGLIIHCFGPRTDRDNRPLEGSCLLLAWCDTMEDLDEEAIRSEAAPTPAQTAIVKQQPQMPQPQKPLQQPRPQQTQTQPQRPIQQTQQPQHPMQQTPPDSGAGTDINADEPPIPALIMDFLDLKGAPEKLKFFKYNRDMMTEDMLETIAAVLDIELRPGSIENRADDIQSCLETIVRYERER